MSKNENYPAFFGKDFAMVAAQHTRLNMSGIYIHIPFCKQACHYCDFHFSTTLKHKDQMLLALQSELQLRRSEIKANEKIATLYFGGGTPTVLPPVALQRLIDVVYQTYEVADDIEITVEANPDDLSEPVLEQLAEAKVNRLSIGVQSFFDADLALMNRAHNATEAKKCLAMASGYFENISIDLIFGIPGMTAARWKENLTIALASGVPHLSTYALTVESKTALEKLIEKGVVPSVEEDLAREHFEILVPELERAGFVHYELSNFGKPGFYSKNNTAYWQGKTYLGIGPSAHSFNGWERSWNVRNNNKYIKALQKAQLPNTTERLSKTDRYNEYVMTGLRTMWGVSLQKIVSTFGRPYKDYLLEQAAKYLKEELLFLEKDTLVVSKKGKFLSDGIASDFFFLDPK